MKKILLTLTSMVVFSAMAPAQAAETAHAKSAAGYTYCMRPAFDYNTGYYVTKLVYVWTPTGYCV